ncbi:MAG: porin [Xanthobacteraceae bacterium]|uniref:porin n=1 Tax=Pseudolabrys sp. TaxID=1960880 RepID=UPI003D0F4F11
MKICSLYGAGFYYIPGTDTCLKVGGWVRFETGWGYNGSFTTEFFNNNTNNRSTNEMPWRVKGTITFDAREQTAYGTLRSYAALGVSNNNNGANDIVANYANRWFIQWAGFTVGHATSFFDFYSIGGNQYGFVTASSDTGDGGWDVFGYTAQFGNGMSASLSAEVARRTKIIRADAGSLLNAGNVGAVTGVGPTGANTVSVTGVIQPSNTVGGGYGGHDMPDIVANLRVDQAWGSAQVMGALHQVNATYYGPSAGGEASGGPDSKLGFAVAAGLKLNAPMLGAGDFLQVEVDYTKGASRYSNSTAATFDMSKYDGTTFGWGFETDAVYGGTLAGANGSNVELTSTWALNAAYTHFWTPALKSTLWGSYREVNYNNSANAMLCSGLGLGTGSGTGAAATAGCDMDWSAWGLGLRTEWAATKNLSIGLEVLYAELNSASTPTGTIALAGNGTKPAATYTVADQDQVAIRFRATRNFYP